MTWPALFAAAAGAALLAGGWAFTVSGPARDFGASTMLADLAAGQRLYAEVCASCHGVNLEGQPNWREVGADGVFPAPPHDRTGHTWHHPDRMLFNYVKHGGKAVLAEMGVDAPSGMPGFGDQLSDAEIGAVLTYIKSIWPERQRQVQAGQTRADQEQDGS